MAYVDGFLLVVPTKKLKAYQKIATLAGKVWLSHGALQYAECVADDLSQKMGETFVKRAKPKKGESVVFSWILYKSKAQRNAVNKKVMKDKRLASFMKAGAMPFDLKRMSYAGFKPFVYFGKG